MYLYFKAKFRYKKLTIVIRFPATAFFPHRSSLFIFYSVRFSSLFFYKNNLIQNYVHPLKAREKLYQSLLFSTVINCCLIKTIGEEKTRYSRRIWWWGYVFRMWILFWNKSTLQNRYIGFWRELDRLSEFLIIFHTSNVRRLDSLDPRLFKAGMLLFDGYTKRNNLWGILISD